MDAQCISNTTRVCLKALEKHFFLLYLNDRVEKDKGSHHHFSLRVEKHVGGRKSQPLDVEGGEVSMRKEVTIA